MRLSVGIDLAFHAMYPNSVHSWAHLVSLAATPASDPASVITLALQLEKITVYQTRVPQPWTLYYKSESPSRARHGARNTHELWKSAGPKPAVQAPRG